MRKAVPEFETDEQAEHFVESADLTEYNLSEFKPTQFEFQIKAAQLNMRLPQTLLDAVKSAAKVRGIPYTRFIRETLERVVADRSQNKSVAPRVYTLGNVQFAAEQGLVLVQGRPILLPAKQRVMLEIFILQKDVVITKEALLNHLFGLVNQPEIRVIDLLVMKLRRKLAEAGADHGIGTVWGRGYILREKAADEVEHNRADLAQRVRFREKLRRA